jgi:plastocyanin
MLRSREDLAMRTLFGISTMLLATAMLTACSSSASPHHVSLAATIQNYAFSPRVLRISAGDTVVWKNTDTADHTVTGSQGGPGSFASSTLGTDAVFSEKFSKPGTYHYHCAFHPFMTGTVIVRPPHT